MNDTPFQALDADLDNQDLNNDKLYITEEICEHWRQTSRWTNNLAVIGYFAVGLICLVGIFTIGALGAWFFLFAGLAIIPYMLCRNLDRYSTNIRQAADNSEWKAMEKAFSSMSNAYTIYGLTNLLLGIVLLIMLCFAGFYLVPTFLSTH